MRIHYYVHGRGRGHASRARSIVPALMAAGHEVTLFAGRDAYPMLRADAHLANASCEAVTSLPERLSARSLALASTRVRMAVSRLRHDDIDAVVSDGDLPSVLAARRCGLPSVAIGHGLVFSECARPASCARLPWLREAAKARLSTLGAVSKVAVSFVPLVVRSSSTVLARPRVSLLREEPIHDVVCYFRDPAAQVVRALVAQGMSPVVFAELDPEVDGARHHPIDPVAFAAALVRARAVVATAGSQLLGECTSLGTPVFALHRRDDDEQRLNVQMLRSSGYGDGSSFEGFEPRRLVRFFERPPTPRTRRGLEELVDVAQAVVERCEVLMRRCA